MLALRYAWALPATLVGALAGMLALGLGARGRIVAGTAEIGGGRLASLLRVLPARFRFEAITLGHVIVGIDHRALARHRDHERVHVRQYERWGLLFFPLYFGSSLWQLMRGRDPYLDNCFEREAFAVEEEQA
ncbi:MAG TPA: signal peptide prediction [Burkholderiaceae bacterium]|nr:signal peptide prediction [Burkholderiaceae bacterium]